MKGCFRRAGCLVLIIALVALWYWYARVERPAPSTKPAAGTAATAGTSAANTGWEPLTTVDA